MVDKEGQPFNAYVRFDKDENRPRFYRWNPTERRKVEAVAEENKTQVAVNNEGKTNEATKNVKSRSKSGQTRPDESRKPNRRKTGTSYQKEADTYNCPTVGQVDYTIRLPNF